MKPYRITYRAGLWIVKHGTRWIGSGFTIAEAWRSAFPVLGHKI